MEGDGRFIVTMLLAGLITAAVTGEVMAYLAVLGCLFGGVLILLVACVIVGLMAGGTNYGS
jgi:hypothetical protein